MRVCKSSEGLNRRKPGKSENHCQKGRDFQNRASRSRKTKSCGKVPESFTLKLLCCNSIPALFIYRFTKECFLLRPVFPLRLHTTAATCMHACGTLHPPCGWIRSVPPKSLKGLGVKQDQCSSRLRTLVLVHHAVLGHWMLRT